MNKRGQYEVWHADMARRAGEPPLDFPEAYTRQARVEAKALEEAARLTTHIDRPWQENPGVEGMDGARSTTIGDVIVDPSGQPHLLEGDGFRAIGDDPIPGPEEFKRLAREIREDFASEAKEAAQRGSGKKPERER